MALFINRVFINSIPIYLPHNHFLKPFTIYFTILFINPILTLILIFIYLHHLNLNNITVETGTVEVLKPHKKILFLGLRFRIMHYIFNIETFTLVSKIFCYFFQDQKVTFILSYFLANSIKANYPISWGKLRQLTFWHN